MVIQHLVVVDALYNRLYELLVEELGDLSIGYLPNKARMAEMNDLVHKLHWLASDKVSRGLAEKTVTSSLYPEDDPFLEVELWSLYN